MKMVREEVRKGPWTEQEDSQLVGFVGLFGDRRWDFIAKVSGLKVAGDQYHDRTGKSCRLRWVNYLHPGLKRGKLTPGEEKLVLELHSKWGNRWSRIARKLPGRTDNEIKNYWRTHMRKKAQEKKRTMMLAPSYSTSCSSASNDPKLDSLPLKEFGEEIFYDTGGPDAAASMKIRSNKEERKTEHAMDDIWREIALSEEDAITPANECYSEEGCSFFCPQMVSPTWEYSSGSGSLWKMQDEDCKMLPRIRDSLFSCYEDLEYLSG